MKFRVHLHGDDIRCPVCRECDHSQKTDCWECGHLPVVTSFERSVAGILKVNPAGALGSRLVARALRAF